MVQFGDTMMASQTAVDTHAFVTGCWQVVGMAMRRTLCLVYNSFGQLCTQPAALRYMARTPRSELRNLAPEYKIHRS